MLTKKAAITRKLTTLDERGKYALLKEILTVLHVGWGIAGAKTPWTRNRKPVPSAELKEVLWKVLPSAKKPERAPCTGKLAVRAVADLGTRTPQKAELLKSLVEEVTEDELDAAIAAAKAKAAASVRVQRDTFELEQPEVAPVPAAGMDIEVMTALEGKPKMWAACEIVAISDGTQDAGRKKRRKVALGRVQVEFHYGDGESECEWLALTSKNFSHDATKFTSAVGAWRVDLDAVAEEEADVASLAGGYSSGDEPEAMDSDEMLSDSESD